ncbi:MAG: type II secretion system GspH family protein [Armatimonadetes bacterium]|nr:type II secretion system GspH family protein [Armatimonadota bacterium]
MNSRFHLVQPQPHKTKGFTLIEFLVVIDIIAAILLAHLSPDWH